MIGYLSGKIIEIQTHHLLIDVQGVGYLVHVSERLANEASVDEARELFIHTHLRENALELFGFATSWEKRVFLLLVSVSGVGPKIGLAALSALDEHQLLRAIANGDKSTLNSLPGVGKKTAERIVVELTEKAQKLLLLHSSGAQNKGGVRESGGVPPQGATASEDIEALEALMALGYKQPVAMMALKEAAAQIEGSHTTQRLIKASLQWMARN